MEAANAPEHAALLLGDDGDLTQAFQDVLHEIFKRFDEDQNGSLNDSELDKFVVTLNGKPFDAAEKQQLRDVLDVTADGSLTLEGFYQLYHTQTTASPEETWADLAKVGYDRTLNKASS